MMILPYVRSVCLLVCGIVVMLQDSPHHPQDTLMMGISYQSDGV